MSTSKPVKKAIVFSNEAIRWLVAFITFALPILVTILSFTRLSSISASYYTGARDVFVGLLFVLGSFLLVYKGHSRREDWIANLGGVAAILAAIFPTLCDSCPVTPIAYIHAIAGNVLFLVTAYFCLGPFRQAAITKPWPKAQRRASFYAICGYSIIACIVILLIIGFAATAEFKKTWTPVFWGELLMLWIFSAAWAVAAKWIPWFTDRKKDNPLNLSREFQLPLIDKPGIK